MTNMKKKPAIKAHGGAGRGQGRKALSDTEPTVIVSVRMTASQKEKLAGLGGSAWMRQRIDRAKGVE